jgi:lipoate-protein ligase A
MSGYSIHPQVVPALMLDALRAEAARLAAIEPGAAHGIRDLLRKSPLVRSASRAPWLRALLPRDVVCVRGILFDKTPETNWLVPWHQDLTLCVRERHETPGYGPWSVKHDVPHVQAPVGLLSRMMTLRLHLDDATLANGALRVLPGSHAYGLLDAEALTAWREREPEAVCEAAAGDVLAMCPLLLHASSKAECKAGGHRRVVHLEFAPSDGLAEGLAWYEGQIFSSLQVWIDPEPREGALNMALDEALLERATGPILRVYRWAEPSVSIGYSQDLTALRGDLPGWPIVRRWTGGGVVLHDTDSTYSLIIPSSDPWSQTRPSECYREVHHSLALSLRGAGHGACRLATEEDQKTGAVCFQSPAVHDVVRLGEKVAGAGQRRSRLGLLHQGSVRGAALDAGFWLGWAAALAAAVRHMPELPPGVQSRATELAAERYATEAWLRRLR